MYRLLIVDDEPVIADGLYDFFRELSHLNLEVHKAYLGSEALEKLNGIKIDIVLSDICMPDLSGLELLREIKDRWPLCKVIFLTGYHEFNYIQTAIRYGGFDYLLKTEEDDVVQQAVEKAIAQIDQETQKEQLVEKASAQLEQTLPLLQNNYLTDLLLGMESSLPERTIRFQELKIPLYPDHPVLLLVGRMDRFHQEQNLAAKIRVQYGIHNIIEDCLKEIILIQPIFVEYSKLVWIFQARNLESQSKIPNPGEMELMTPLVGTVEGSLDSIQASCRKILDLKVSFILSGGFVSWEQVGPKFADLNLMLCRGIGLGEEILLTDQSINKYHSARYTVKNSIDSVDYQVRVLLKRLGLMEVYLENGQPEQFQKFYTYLMGKVNEEEYIATGLAAEVFYAIANLFLSYLNKLDLKRAIADQFDLNRLIRMETFNSWEEVVDYFQRLAELLFSFKVDEQLANSGEVTGNIQRYIKTHFSEDLSLTKLSEIAHFNPSYLSRFYKQITGKSLSDYITEVRINQAKELLRGTDLQIQEIALKVGYETAYFIRLFKKIICQTPQEFRDSIKKQPILKKSEEPLQ